MTEIRSRKSLQFYNLQMLQTIKLEVGNFKGYQRKVWLGYAILASRQVKHNEKKSKIVLKLTTKLGLLASIIQQAMV